MSARKSPRKGVFKMDCSRRELGLLPLLAASFAGSVKAASAVLPSKTYLFESLPVKVNGQNRARAVFDGETHSGFPVEFHMTELAPGQAPHAAHHHVHE